MGNCRMPMQSCVANTVPNTIATAVPDDVIIFGHFRGDFRKVAAGFPAIFAYILTYTFTKIVLRSLQSRQNHSKPANLLVPEMRDRARPACSPIAAFVTTDSCRFDVRDQCAQDSGDFWSQFFGLGLNGRKIAEMPLRRLQVPVREFQGMFGANRCNMRILSEMSYAGSTMH